MARSMQGVVKAECGDIHYAWLVCVGCMLLMFDITGLSINVATIYQPYYISQNGLTNAQGSSMTMVRSCFSLFSVMLSHQYYRRIRLKTGIFIACLLNMVSFLIFSVAHSLPAFYLASAFVGLAHGLGSMIPISILIDRWFADRRAFALSLCASGSGLATIFAPLILEAVIHRYGIAVSLVWEAVFTLGVAMFLAWTMKGRPEEKGVGPYRCKGTGSGRSQRSRFQSARHLRLDGKELSAVFSVLFLFGLVVTPGTSHLAVHFATAGYDDRWVTLAISLFGIALTTGQYIYGHVTDRIGTYQSNFLFLGMQAAGWLVIGLAGDGVGAALVGGVALIGLGLPTSAVGVSLWAADFSSAAEYDVTVERYQAVFMTGGLLGSTLPGIIADLTGSYGPTFFLYALFVSMMSLLLRWVYRRHQSA